MGDCSERPTLLEQKLHGVPGSICILLISDPLRPRPPPSRYAALIGGESLLNVTLTGGGLIDGQGEVWWRRSGRLPGHPHTLLHTRGRLVQPAYSAGLRFAVLYEYWGSVRVLSARLVLG